MHNNVCFNLGIGIQVIHPATEEDFQKFIDVPIQMVNETVELYEAVVKPHIKNESLQQVRIVFKIWMFFVRLFSFSKNAFNWNIVMYIWSPFLQNKWLI